MRNKTFILFLATNLITMVVGIGVIIGWFTNNDFLRAVVPGQVKMNFNEGLGFILSSVVLLLHFFFKKNRTGNIISVILAMIVTCIGLSTLIEYIFNTNIGIDELFVKDEVRTTATYYSGRMSPLSAIFFLLIGIGLFLLGNIRTATYQFFYLTAITFFSLLMLIGFNLIADLPAFVRLPIHAAIGFIALSAAIWFAQPVLHRKIRFDQKLITGFASVILLVIMLGIFSSYYNQKRISTNESIKSSNQIITEAGQTLSLVKDIESGGRGYVITGDSDYLEPLIVAKNSVYGHVRRLQEFAGADTFHRQRIDSLTVLLEKQIAFSLQCIRVRNDKGFNEASKLLPGGQGKFYTDAIRKLTSEIISHEEFLLAQRHVEIDKSIVAFNRAFFIFLTLFFIFLLVILFSVRKNIAVRRKAEEKFRSLLNAAPDATIIVNDQGVIEMINHQTENLFGHQRDELIGKPVEVLIPENLRLKHIRHRSGYVRAPKIRAMGASIELNAIKKNGETFPVEISLSPLQTEEGILVSASVRDITDRKKAEEKFRSLLESAPDAMVIVNAVGKIELVNQQVENLFGYKREELIGHEVEILIPPDVRERHVHHRSGFFKEAGVRPMGVGIELRAIKKDQSSFPVEISLSPITTSEGLLVCASIRDITDRKKAEKKFRSLLDAAPDATIIVNDKGRIEMINDQTENLFGYQRDELVGKPVELLIPENVRMRHGEHRAGYMRSPKVRTMGAGIELKAIKKNGVTFPVEISLSPLETEEGILVSASVRDITDRKKTEEKIRENEQMFSSLFHKSPVLSAISEISTGKFIEVNDAFADFMNYKKQELIDRTSRELNTLVNYGQRQNVIKEVMQKGFVRNIEVEILTRDGKTKWISTNIDRVNLRGKDCIITAAIDISSRREVEELTRKQRQEIQDFIDSMSTLCAKVAPDGTLLMVNKIAMQASGLSIEKLFNTNFLDGPWWTFDAGVRSRVKEAFDKAASGQSVTYDENIFVFGQVRTVNFSLIPIFSTENEVDYIVAEGRDITTLKHTEAALTEKTDQLIKLNEELEAFTYSVSHDLRAPLRGIIGFTNILEEDYSSKLDDEARRITSVIKSNTLKMGYLVDDLLTFSRMGKKEIIKTEVDSAKLVDEIINEMSLQNNDKKIRWNIGSLHPVIADINTIRQVWINLISNAVKYSAKNNEPCIGIGSFVYEREVVFYIKDNGVGFDESYKHKLFKVFQRLHSAEEFEGTGVGLALVEKIVARHGGRVWAEGKVNKGASFYFSLPA